MRVFEVFDMASRAVVTPARQETRSPDIAATSAPSTYPSLGPGGLIAMAPRWRNGEAWRAPSRDLTNLSAVELTFAVPRGLVTP